MLITDIKIRKLIFDDKPVKAIASITIDNAIAIHDIKVIELKGKRFLAFPAYKDKQGINHDSVHPITTEHRAIIEGLVFCAYQQAYDEYVITHADC